MAVTVILVPALSAAGSMSRAKVPFGRASVSYTHLDVYKRQNLNHSMVSLSNKMILFLLLLLIGGGIGAQEGNGGKVNIIATPGLMYYFRAFGSITG